MDLPETPYPELSRESTPAELESSEDAATVPRLLHFKVPFCSNIVWGQWAQKFFDPPPARILVMAEHLNKATAHVHMQGTSSKSDRQIKRLREDMTHEHSLFKEFKRQKDNPDYKDYGRKRCRLIQTVDKRRPCNETGFQYMCKEFHPPLFSQGFSKEELKQLHEDSNTFVADKKMKINDMLTAILEKDAGMQGIFKNLSNQEDCKKFMHRIHFQICEMHREIDQKLPKSRYFGDDVINALYQRKDCPANFRVYLANKLAKF